MSAYQSGGLNLTKKGAAFTERDKSTDPWQAVGTALQFFKANVTDGQRRELITSEVRPTCLPNRANQRTIRWPHFHARAQQP